MGKSENDRTIHRLENGNITVQARIPPGVGLHPVFVLLHGWTGDENSMWIFASRLPENALLLAPRGIFESPLGGYSWYPKLDRNWPRLEDFQAAIQAIVSILDEKHFPTGDFSRIRMVGFSQGAALCYSFVLLHSERVRAVAGLSGFAPDGASFVMDSKPLAGIPIFIAHGTQDQIVKVERARLGVGLLQRAGASVSYCEHDVGHKLNAACFRSLQSFFQQN